MRKCQICHEDEAISAWQPFGPADAYRDGTSFMAFGSHYRGFPVLNVCHECKGMLQNGETIHFVYRGMTFEAVGEVIRGPFPSPYSPIASHIRKSE